MPCYSPIRAFEGPVGESGKRSIVWRRELSVRGKELVLPCGQCFGCRLEYSRQWAIRCLHESELYDRNCFITLTYDDEHFPEGGTLVLRDFQNFMKRLRKFYACDCKLGRTKVCKDHAIRFYHAGEYGEKFNRPHYHALLFNHDFEDKELLMERNGNRIYTSRILELLWSDEDGVSLGYSSIGHVTFESAAYVARYVMKKVTNEESRFVNDGTKFVPAASEHYGVRKPEYCTMSRRPGIGKSWYDKFRSDVYPADNVVLRENLVAPPKYYDSLLGKDDPELLSKLKERRLARNRTRMIWSAPFGERVLVPDGNMFRLPVKEAVKRASINSLRRELECKDED